MYCISDKERGLPGQASVGRLFEQKYIPFM